ncbi:MAG: response regulator [Nitrospira sp.]|nr:response regulator [Nitrospira sp.]
MKNVRLLIADDDALFLRYLGDLLSDDFCTVATVSDGTAVIAAVVAFDPHIIITNIDMPAMTRLDAVRQLEALMPDMKIIVLTDQVEPEFAAATLGVGASAVLIKETPGLCGKIKAIVRDVLPAHSESSREKLLPAGIIEHG